jgi:hypothetical protein
VPSITAILKNEIARVARKDLRVETENLKKASAQYRSEIAALKRRLITLEQQSRRWRWISYPLIGARPAE